MAKKQKTTNFKFKIWDTRKPMLEEMDMDLDKLAKYFLENKLEGLGMADAEVEVKDQEVTLTKEQEKLLLQDMADIQEWLENAVNMHLYGIAKKIERMEQVEAREAKKAQKAPPKVRLKGDLAKRFDQVMAQRKKRGLKKENQ